MPIILPQLNYIIFQLVSFYPDHPDDIKEEMVVSMSVMPTALRYRLISRDAVLQTQASIFTDKFPMAPVQCSLSGSFGSLPRPQALSLLNGFQRLKEMELLFRRSKSIDDQKLFDEFLSDQGFTLRPPRASLNAQEEPNQKIYALNYYDFVFQQFFRVNLTSLDFYGNAVRHAIQKYYDLSFTSAGPHLAVQSTDPLLTVLTNTRALIAEATGFINDALADLSSNEIVNGIATVAQGVQVAAQLEDSIMQTIRQMLASFNNIVDASELLPIIDL